MNTNRTFSNLLQVLKQTVDTKPNAPCFRHKENGAWHTLTFLEVYKKVLDLCGGLQKLGIQKGDRVCIFSRTRYEWTIADFAIMSCGGITVPIYESSIPEQVGYILENCGAKIIFAEGASHLKRIEEVRNQCPALRQIILFDEDQVKREDGIYSFDEIVLLGSGLGEEIFLQMHEELKPEDDVSFVYTSGTTGPPKGAILTHGNFIAESVGILQVLDFRPQTESLLFLPLAHIFARVVQFAQIQLGFVQAYAEGIDQLMDNIAETKPHFLASVPRIFEKVHGRVMQGVHAGSPTKQKIFDWALKVGRERADLLLAKKEIPFSLSLQWILAFRLVFLKLHQKLGGRIQFFISGGAPLSVEIADFFNAAGLLILEGYGLTETTASITCNSNRHLKVGTVGQVVPGGEIKIASDGEILARGGMVFKGYYKRPAETKEAIDVEGWFHTGDIGIIDSDGFLKITDRKKDIIVTAAGKNVAPQNIENLIKTDPYISQILVLGDKRKYLSALVTLDREQVMRYAKDQQISFKSYGDLVNNEKVYSLIRSRIEDKNKHLAKYESIKKFAILENDFSVESGELTPTLKVKRKFTAEKYKHILDSFYQDHE